MMLLIDAGNTRIKIGWIKPDTGERETQALALEHGALEQLPAWLQQLDAPPSAALGVSVAHPGVAASLDALLRRHYTFAARWIQGEPQAAGVRNAYDTPAQLGADRWVSMLGLAQRATRETPLMLASFGTATTIDTLRPIHDTAIPGARFLFEGGLIFPGPALMLSSLAAGTARLPQANGSIAAYPTHTHQAISSGIAAAQAGALLRQWREGLERHGCAPTVFSTGGGWTIVEEEAQRTLARAQADLAVPQHPIQWLRAPVLDGLARLAVES